MDIHGLPPALWEHTHPMLPEVVLQDLDAVVVVAGIILLGSDHHMAHQVEMADLAAVAVEVGVQSLAVAEEVAPL